MSKNKKEETNFGFRQVDSDEKSKMVGNVFDTVAENYDLMNDLMSFGIHRLWKRVAIESSTLREDFKVLDLAGGTGDMVKLMKEKINQNGLIILSDINRKMLEEGRDRLINEGIDGISLAQIDAQYLPFRDETFDLITIAFGLRNVTHKDAALKQMYRVLKKGGTLLILEFSKVENQMLEKVYDLYSFNLIPKFGEYFANDEDSYQYLAESIRKHPDQETLKTMVLDAGFEFCEYHNLTGGIVALHKAIKI